MLDDAAAIVEWVKGTGLRPFVDPLEPPNARSFSPNTPRASPPPICRRRDGKVLLRFPRLFIVAVRNDAPRGGPAHALVLFARPSPGSRALLPVHAPPMPHFTHFIASLWPDAQKAGVSRATFDAATRGLEPDYNCPI